MAPGAKVALATRPAVRSSPPAPSAGTSATSGPMRTRRLLPAGATEAIGARMRLRDGSAGPAGVDRDVPRVDDGPDRALGPGDGADDAPVLQDHLGQAALHRPGDPGHEVAADEAGDEGVRRRVEQAGGGVGLVDPPVHDHPDPVGQRRGVLEVVGHQQGGEAQLPEEIEQLGAHLRARVGVEGGERLVEEQHGRVARHGPGQAHALALAARQAPRPRVGQVGDAEPLQQLVGPRATGEGHVLAHGHVREQRVLLEHVPHPARLRGQVDAPLGVEERLVAERDPAGAGPHRAGDRPQHRRLARAGRADEGDGLALADLERYVEREVAKRNGDVESEVRHRRISLSERRTTTLMTTSSAPMARATLKSTESSS